MIKFGVVEGKNKTHDGVSLGLALGFTEGDSLGLAEGFAEGESLGVALGSDEGNELGLWVARTTPSIINTPSSLRVSLLVSNSSRICAGSTDSPVATISKTKLTTVD